MIVRSATAADVPAIAAIYQRSVETDTASWEEQAPDAAEMANRYGRIVAAGFPYIVAEHEGAIAGYAYASSYRARAAYRHTVENSIYVDEAHRKRGVGKLLLDALVLACAERGFREMIAIIGSQDSRASIRLHTACGFRHIGTFQGIGFKFGQRLDSVQMQRSL